jgi:hypothetical protein
MGRIIVAACRAGLCELKGGCACVGKKIEDSDFFSLACGLANQRGKSSRGGGVLRKKPNVPEWRGPNGK